MQIATLKLESRAALTGPKPGEKMLDPRNTKHAWGRGIEHDAKNPYYGTPYSFNTKYVVDVTAHPKVGCWIELVSGKRVHVDESLEFVTQRCNQR